MTETSVRLRVPVVETPRAVARPRERSTALWLGGLVLLSAGIRFAIAAAAPGPAIFPDETIYAELARSVASSGEFLVRDVPFSGWTYGPLYVLLIAPAFLIPSLPEAYLAVAAINAVVMSLAALPAYYIARRMMDERLARVAALMTLLIPAMALSSRIMTESLFYPLFLLFVIAAVRVIEHPSGRRQVVALASIGACCLVRAEALILVPALLTAAAGQATLDLHSVGTLSIRRLVRQVVDVYRLTLGALALVAAALVLASALVGVALPGLVWERVDYILDRLRLETVPQWMLYHAAELVLVLGVIPFAAFVLLVRRAFGAPMERRLQVFVVTTLALTTWLVLLASAFASQREVDKILERYVFYLEPLYFIALLAWIATRAEVARRRDRLVVVATATLPLALVLGSLIGYRGHGSTPGLLPWLLVRNIGGIVGVAIALMLLGACATYVVVCRRNPLRMVTPYVAVCTVIVTATFASVSQLSVSTGAGSGELAWVDQAVGPSARVSALSSTRGEEWRPYRKIWVNEFYNRSIRGVYYLWQPLPHPLPDETRVHLRGRALVTPDGQILRAEYVLSDGPIISGRKIASRPQAGLTLYRVDGPVRVIGAGT